MNPKELEANYQIKKSDFHKYIDRIKEKMPIDIYSIINTTLIKNPYTTNFPIKYFLNNYTVGNKYLLFITHSIKFYCKQSYIFISYFISFLLFKIYYKKNNDIFDNVIGIDVFFLVDKIINDGEFNESYLIGIYDILDKYKKKYVFIPRLYGVNKNPFKLIKLFRILNKEKRNFLFEFEFLKFNDFVSLFWMILLYPFKTIRLLQKEICMEDVLFNDELIKNISSLSFESFSRYIYGKNIAKFKYLNKIYSWNEFQVIERSFNFAIRINSNVIKLYGCQFYVFGETYFNTIIDNIDFIQKTSYHEVLVNGKQYIKNMKFIKYKNGVSLRYKNLFNFSKNLISKDVLLLGSYMENETKNMLEYIHGFEKIVFKSHPAVNINRFGKLGNNILVTNKDIYELFKSAEIIISSESGTVIEAVTCGISVIIIASSNNLTVNPLVSYGKGKIWDIAFSKDDVKRLYNNLIEYRKNNHEEVQEIALWYKENFFIEPTEENIIKAFELDKG